jgi:hypothetical protein
VGEITQYRRETVTVEEMQKELEAALRSAKSSADEATAAKEAIAKHFASQSLTPQVRSGKQIIVAEDAANLISKRGQAGAIQLRVSLTDVDALIDETKTPLVRLPQARLGFVDTIPVVPCPSGARKAPVETSRGNWGSLETASAAATVADEDTLVLASVAGIPVGAVGRLYTDSGFIERTIASIDDTANEITVDSDWGAVVTSGHAFVAYTLGIVPESGTKPTMPFGITKREFSCKTIPVLCPVTEQALSSVGELEIYLRTVMAERVRTAIEWNSFYADGVTGLSGVMGTAGILTYAWSTGDVGDNRVDCVMKASATVKGANKIVTLNPRDFVDILCEKDSAGAYVHTSVSTGNKLRAVGNEWYIGDDRVAFSDMLRQGDFTIHAAGAVDRIEKGPGTFALGYVNDQFQRNEITARYEVETEICVLRADGVLAGEFDAPPSED